MIEEAINQTIIVFLILQVIFGFIIFQRQKDLIYALGELVQTKYLKPTIIITVAFFFVNIILRVIMSIF